MRKLKLQVQMTIDGFIGGLQHEMDWMKFPWSTDIMTYVGGITAPVDTILLGKNLAMGFIPHWEHVAQDPNAAEYEAGVKFSNTSKVVFTKTLEESIWKNTILAKGDLIEEVNSIKNQAGGDLIAYGGGMFVSALIKENLIDEYHLFINPVCIGRGLPIFNEIQKNLDLNLVKCRKFECGIALLAYDRPAR
jgi:dihydrofolate reductase